MSFSEPVLDRHKDNADLYIFSCANLNYEFSQKGKYLGQGLSRSCYDMGDYVVKIPRFYNDKGDLYNRVLSIYDGNCDNWAELSLYTNNSTKYALAEILDYKIIGGVHVVYMEKLTETRRWMISLAEARDRGIPDWFHLVYDGCQAGFDKNGVFKVYDYANEYEQGYT